MSRFCRATFSSKTILSFSLSLPCVREKIINTGISSKPSRPPEDQHCFLVLNPLTTPLQAVSSWAERFRTSLLCSSSRVAAWKFSASASCLRVLTSASRLEISSSIIERIWTAWAEAKNRNDDGDYLHAPGIRFYIPQTKLTQEVVVMMQWPLSAPVFVHKVEEHLLGFPITTLEVEIRDNLKYDVCK